MTVPSSSITELCARAGGIPSEDLCRLAFDSAPDGILLIDPAGSIVLVNTRLEQDFGYAQGELVGQPVRMLLPEGIGPAHGGDPAEHSAMSLAPSNGLRRERIGRRKDGSSTAVAIGVTPIQTDHGVFVLASLVDTGGRSRQEGHHDGALRELLEFERIVSELAAAFINVPPDHVDSMILDALHRIADALDLDRSSLFQFGDGGDDFLLTHNWARQVESIPGYVSARMNFPWSEATIRRGELAMFTSRDEVPDPIERATLQQLGTKSRVAIPLWIEGRVVGAISFATTRRQRPWSAEMLGQLQLVAQVLSGALARKHAATALRASEERFRTVADDAPVMIWISGPDKKCTWLNRRWLEFVGEPLEHEVGAGWVAAVHAEDRDACIRTYETEFDARRPFSMEYRLRRHDGEWRWVLDRGGPTYAADGSFSGYIGSCIDITEQKEAKLDLEKALANVRQLRDQLQVENVYLRHEVEEELGPGNVVGKSTTLRSVLEQVEQVATTDSTVLLLGETGTGKELFATHIHERSARKARTMVRVNCAAIPATLIESELFGREKGAFTGALARQIGRFEMADHSTIFLDEIGDLPAEVQVKLLRVLEERRIERLGSPTSIRVDTRIIAATHRDLDQLMAAGTFRADLFYRLNVFPIRVPPLRERIEDIPLLVWRFVEEFSKAFGKRIESISRENLTALQQYPWPGNIRELRNVVERAMITATGPRLTIVLPDASPAAVKRSAKLVDVERTHIRSVLEGTNWRIRGPGGAADRLGLKPTTLETRLAKLGLKRPAPHA
jgi:PAS domain S-box-containing protein